MNRKQLNEKFLRTLKKILPLNQVIGYSPFNIHVQVWILANITLCMSVKVFPGDEPLATQTAVVWILSNMTLHVSRDVVPGDESLATQITQMWILPSMTVDVSF